MSSWEALADLPLQIEDYSLTPLQAQVSSAFERKSTLIRLRGAGEEGAGEDVTYDALDHEILEAEGPTLPLAGHRRCGPASGGGSRASRRCRRRCTASAHWRPW